MESSMIGTCLTLRMELHRPAKDGRYDTAGVLRTQTAGWATFESDCEDARARDEFRPRAYFRAPASALIHFGTFTGNRMELLVKGGRMIPGRDGPNSHLTAGTK